MRATAIFPTLCATRTPFLMPIEDVFTIMGRGTVVTERVERGKVKAGEEVEIVGMSRDTKKTRRPGPGRGRRGAAR